MGVLVIHQWPPSRFDGNLDLSCCCIPLFSDMKSDSSSSYHRLNTYLNEFYIKQLAEQHWLFAEYRTITGQKYKSMKVI